MNILNKVPLFYGISRQSIAYNLIVVAIQLTKISSYTAGKDFLLFNIGRLECLKWQSLMILNAFNRAIFDLNKVKVKENRACLI